MMIVGEITAARPTLMFAGDNSAGRGILAL
jgi:hypothetical protein